MALRGAREARGSGELCAVGIWMGMRRALPKQQPGVEEPLKVTQILKRSWFFNLYLIFTQNAVLFFQAEKTFFFIYFRLERECFNVYIYALHLQCCHPKSSFSSGEESPKWVMHKTTHWGAGGKYLK